MPEVPEMKDIEVPILSGSYLNLELIDVSFKDISIINIQSQAFKNYLDKYSTPDNDGYNYYGLQSIFDDIHGEYDKKYAVVPNNPIGEFNSEDIYNVWRILLIIHPSDLQIEYELFYRVDDGSLHTSGYAGHGRRYTGDYPGKLLINKKEYVSEINQFIKRVFPLLSRTDYLGLCIYHYLTSYSASHFHYQYTSLFTALDCLISNGSELQYRLKRGIAILCGEDAFTSNLIYDKVHELALLRNDIVHGNPYLMANVNNYLPSLKSLVSRVIIELLIHDIDQGELNDAFKRLGFGQREQISKNWKEYRLNILTQADANWIELPAKVKAPKKK
jgi:Apea-like HEPN